MKIFIHCVGKLKESYLKQAVEDYSKRIGQYCHIEILEVPDLPIPEHSSASIEEEIKEKECAAMLKSMKSSDFLVICDLQGKQMESPQFADALSSFFIKGARASISPSAAPLGYRNRSSSGPTPRSASRR